MLKLCILGMSIALVGGVGVVSMSATHEQNENVVNINRENKKLVSYDDQNYVITFSVNELNNYIWENYYNLVYNYIGDGQGEDSLNESVIDSVSYNDETLSYDDYWDEYGENNFEWLYVGSNIQVHFNKNADYKYTYESNDVVGSFEYDLAITYYYDKYSEIKSAIELDIQANMDSSNGMPSIADLFQQVTAAVNAFIGSLGDAFTQVTSLFWVTEGTNQGPTFLGLLILIGVGVGLVYLAYRTIRSLIHRI